MSTKEQKPEKKDEDLTTEELEHVSGGTLPTGGTTLDHKDSVVPPTVSPYLK